MMPKKEEKKSGWKEPTFADVFGGSDFNPTFGDGKIDEAKPLFGKQDKEPTLFGGIGGNDNDTPMIDLGGMLGGGKKKDEKGAKKSEPQRGNDDIPSIKLPKGKLVNIGLACFGIGILLIIINGFVPFQTALIGSWVLAGGLGLVIAQFAIDKFGIGKKKVGGNKDARSK